MAKRPLRDELGMPAAALPLFFMLLAGFSGRSAFAGSEEAQQVPRALDGATPAAGKDGGEPVPSPVAQGLPKETSSAGVPVAAKSASAGPGDEAGRQKDATGAPPAEK